MERRPPPDAALHPRAEAEGGSVALASYESTNASFQDAKLITARDLRVQMVRFTAVFSVTTIALIATYLFALLRLSPEELIGFLQLVAGLFPVLFGGTMWVNRRLLAGLMACLDAEERGGAGGADVEAGFRALAALPGALFVSGLFWWTLGGALVGAGMWLRFDTFGGFDLGVMALAAATGGFISSVFMFFAVKRRFAGLRCALASRIPDPAERESWVTPIGVGRKLRVSVTGVTFLTVSFGLLLSQVGASGPLETRTLDLQQRFLLARMDMLRQPDEAAFAAVAREAADLGIASQLVRLDRESGAVIAGPTDALLEGERAGIDRASAVGGSAAFDSANVFAWRALPDGRSIVVAVQPWSAIGGSSTGLWLRFAITLLAAGVLALALARYLARDIGETTSELGRRARLLAEGDLRASGVYESEDELGALSRAFERMARALGVTVRRVADAADGVEATASETATVAEGVSSAARLQSAGVADSAHSMESVTQQAAGIEGSAHELGVLVEEATSAVLELVSAGEQLAQTASVLFSKVDEVSAAIEQNAEGVHAVGSNAGALSETADETAASMEQMAVSMRHVNAAAAASAELSQRVVETAETGRETVRQSTTAMQALREEIGAAEQVIRGLGRRADEIGSIVDVIDDVADETGLLALNAAIIAAQAGDHGRGFAVVAGQIKQLAGRVLASTREIGERIRSVQEESAQAVAAIAAGARSADASTALSTQSGRALEEITRVARESGERIAQSFDAVDEQTRAAGYVAERMERVKQRVEAISHAAAEQELGNERILLSTASMREIAQQVRATTGEQAIGCTRIRESIEGVRSASEAIHEALRAQSVSCRAVAEFLEGLAGQHGHDDELARRLEQVTRELTAQANRLREDVERFRL